MSIFLVLFILTIVLMHCELCSLKCPESWIGSGNWFFFCSQNHKLLKLQFRMLYERLLLDFTSGILFDILSLYITGFLLISDGLRCLTSLIQWFAHMGFSYLRLLFCCSWFLCFAVNYNTGPVRQIRIFVLFSAVLRIRSVYPGSDFSFPDPNLSSYRLSIFNPKNCL